MTIWGSGRTEIRFFWRREIAFFSTIDEARDFVKKHWKDKDVAARLKSLLWRTGGLVSEDKEVIEQIAQLLAQGELLTERHPLDAFWRYSFGVREKNMVVQFLGGFQRDLLVMERFRNALRQKHGDAEFLRLSDAEVLVGVTKLLQEGELTVAFRSPPAGSSTGESSGSSSASPSEPAPAPRQSAAPPVEEESPTFSNNDGSTQAAALQQAAEKGLPFCEECAK